MTVDNVLDAVNHGIKREMSKAFKAQATTLNALTGKGAIDEHVVDGVAVDEE